LSLVVNYIAPADGTGYACAASGYMQLLCDAGIRVHFCPLQAGPGLGLWYECVTPDEPLDPCAVTVLHVVPEYYGPLQTWLHAHGVHGPVVGMTVWETSRIPIHWPALLNRMSAVIVPSAWNRQVFQECGVHVPIFQVPHASQFEGIPASTAAVETLRNRLPNLQGKFVFYSIGAWSHRKGNDLLVRAFKRAFDGRSDIALVLKSSAASLDPSRPRWQRALRKLLGVRGLHEKLTRGRVPGVTLLTGNLSEKEIQALHTVGDCYVSCARGEGWALGLYEAIRFGNLVLAPRQGGHREYLRDESYPGLLEGAKVKVRTPGRDDSYRPDQIWFETDVRQAAHAMRRVHRDPSQFRAGADAVSTEVRTLFTRDNIFSDLRNALVAVLDCSSRQALQR
jgi:glycosyltransferase involved in cell wall biosynthesis